MNKYKISREAKQTLDQFKVETAGEITGEMTPESKSHNYDLRHNLTDSEDVTEQIVKTREKSRTNPNNSFSDFLGKGF